MSSNGINEKYLEIAVLEISKALSSTLDFDKVLNLSLDLLENLINYSCGFIALREKKFKTIIFRNVEKKEMDLFKKKHLDFLMGETESNFSPKIYYEDTLKFKIKGDNQSALLIPIYFEARPIGFMYFEYEAKETCLNLNLRTISVLSSQIAIAIKNAQLFEEIKIKVAELTALYEISRKLSSLLDYHKIMEIIIDFTHKYFGADFVFLWKWDEIKEKLILTRHRGVKSIQITNVKLKMGEGVAGRVAESKSPLLIPNLNKLTMESEFKSMKVIKSVIASPLTLQDKIIGIIVVADQKEDELSEEDLRMLSILSSLFAISLQNAKLYQDNEMLAITDGLCEVYNHRFFQEKLGEEIKRSARYKENLSLVMIDIDNFKVINDKFGHLQGDLILKEVARILKKDFRETDFVCRYGGEEFAIILPETDALGALTAGERARKFIDKNKFLALKGNKTLKIEVSAGVSSYPRYAQDKEGLIKKADNALYKAKKLGKNKVCLGT